MYIKGSFLERNAWELIDELFSYLYTNIFLSDSIVKQKYYHLCLMSSLSCFPHYCSQSPHLYPCWWELMPISSWRMEVLSKLPKCWKNLGSKNSFFSFLLYNVYVRYNMLYFKRLVDCFLLKLFKSIQGLLMSENII